MDAIDPRPSDDPIDAIAAARRAFVGAVDRRDPVGLGDAYTIDARLLAPSAELIAGRSSIARFWEAGIDAGLETIEMDLLDLEVGPDGAAATEIGRYLLRLASPSGERIEERGRYLIVHRRERDGTWRRATETFSPDDRPSPAGRAGRPPGA